MPDIKEHFNNEAKNFDKQVTKNMPRYNQMLEALISAIPDNEKNPKVLDLGCGTGNITQKIKDRFPEAQVTCLDLSENMMDIAKDKLSGYDDIEYVIGDFTKLELNMKYDAIVSSLALHHIEGDEKKEQMYKKIYDSLETNGVFYNADIIKANSDYNMQLCDEIEFDEMRDNGVSEEEIDEYKEKRDSNDMPTTLYNHIKMLDNVGFQEIDVLWKYYNNAVYGGTKKDN